MMVMSELPLTLAALTICSKSTLMLISPLITVERSLRATGRVIPLQLPMNVLSLFGDSKTVFPW